MFRRIWNGIKDNIGGIIGGALGGPIGAMIGAEIQRMIGGRSGLWGIDISVSPAAEKLVEHWAEVFFKPFFINSVEWVAADKNITNREFVSKYNQILLQLRSWQAYYEATANNPNIVGIDKEVAAAKQLLLLQSVDIFKKAYEEASITNPSELFFENQEYDPTTITDVAGDRLDWNAIGVKKIVANNNFLTDGKETPQSGFILGLFQKAKKELPAAPKVKEGNNVWQTQDKELPKETKEEKEEDNKNITPTPPKKETPTSPGLPDIPDNDTDITVEIEEAQAKGGFKTLLVITAIGMITYKIIN